MDLNLFISTAQGIDVRSSRVVSLTDNAPFPLPAIVFGDRLNVTVYLVDGAGSYNAASGAVGYAPRLALGVRGQTALAYTTTFTQIANGWTCTLDLTTTELIQALSALRAGTLALEFATTATGPTPTTWASLPIDILGHVSDPESGTAIAAPTYYTAAQADALFQPLNALLTALSALVTSANKGLYFTASNTPATYDLTAYARTLLAAATSGDFKTLLSLVKADVGLGSVDNTSDAAKPISTATQAALDLKAPIASPTFTGSVTLPGDPASALQAATKQYVDNLAAGFDVKASVVVATTGNITLSGGQTIDGIAVTTGDRVLVKNQSAPAQNGLYLVAAGAWTRTTDADTWAKLPGAFCFVERGSTLADTGWVCTVDSGGTLGTTAVTFSQFSGVGAYQPLNTNLTAEAGLSGVADRVSYYTGAGAKALATFTAFGRTLLAYADAATCFAGIKQAATTSATGVVELATTAEALAGTDAALVPPVSAVNARDLLGDMQRQIRDSLYSDGATSNRRVEHTPGTAGAVAGMVVSFPFEIQVPTSNPSANAALWSLCSTATNYGSAVANGLELRFNTAGGLDLRASGTTPGTDFRTFTYSGFRAAYSGLWVRGMVVFTAGDSTTAPVIYLQGADASANFSAASGGTPPNWMSAALVTTSFTTGFFMPATRFIPHGPSLGALTAAEVLEWTQTGRLPAWCEIETGSVVDPSSANSFVNSTLPFETFTGASATGFAATNTSGSTKVAYKLLGRAIAAGIRLRVKFTATLNSGAAPQVIAYNNTALAAEASNIVTVAAGANVVDLVVSVAATAPVLVFRSIGASDFSIAGYSVVVLGPIIKPVIQPIAVLADLGTNKLAGILTAGITPVTEKRDWVIQAMTNTNGNQQLLGASTFFDATRHVIDDWCMNTTGTPTVTAGSVSAGAQYKASGALAAARNLITLVTRVLSAVNLWCGSNDTSTIQHTIRGHIVD